MPYLLRHDLVTARAVVDGGLRIVDRSGRNRVFVVTANGERGLVVKQADDGDPAGTRHEAAVLERLRAADRRLAMRLPAPVLYDAAAGILVLEAARDPQDLRRRHARGRYSREIAAQTGRTLALLHAMPPAALGDRAGPWHAPSALRMHRPSIRGAGQLTSAALGLVAAIQRSDELCTALDALYSSPRDDALIHGDVRWDNILTARASERTSARRARVLLLDWECAARGDPSQDVGAFFGEYLGDWIRSIPIVDPGDPGRLVARAGRPLARMRPAIGAFWHAYRGHDGGERDGLVLRRAAQFAAVRVLSAAYEESLTRNVLGGSAHFALQLSTNMLRRPDRAMTQLLGLSATSSAR
ncbi:MAG TPA: phosphotransferase [Solirubrobacteraceae bacterium]|nr:phosphotransferase [Solirubrobacteraceae bacterium]